MLNFSYLQRSKKWRAVARDIDVKRPEDFSIGLFIDSGFVPEILPLFAPKLIGKEYDEDTDDARAQSGIIVSKDRDVDVLLLHSEEDRTLYTIWRGTTTRGDEIANVNFRFRDWPYHQEGQRLRVSSGYADDHERVINLVHRILKKLWSTGKYSRIVVGGHSLGGALAHLNAHALSHLMADELSQSGLHEEERLVCYSFGTPRFCDGRFRDDSTVRIPNSYRVVGDLDIFPLIPLPWREFAGILVLIDERDITFNASIGEHWRNAFDNFKFDDILGDHGILTYNSMLLSYLHKYQMSTAENEAVERAYTALVSSSESQYVVQALEPNAPRKTADQLAKKLVFRKVETPSLRPAGLILRDHFGGLVTSEIVDGMILYGMKCVETYVDVPGEVDPPGRELTIFTFRAIIWDLIANPDESYRAEAVKALRVREVFEMLDDDEDGLITPEQFNRFRYLLDGTQSNEAASAQDAKLSYENTLRELYKLSNFPRPTVEYFPEKMSYAEFFYWVTLSKIDTNSLPRQIEKLKAEQIARKFTL